MNKWIGMGRLTKDVELKYSSTNTEMAIARYTIAVDTGYGDNKRTDFIRCVAFGKAGEFASKYFSKGLRVLVSGNIKTGPYKNKDKVKIPTFDILVETQEFADGNKNTAPATNPEDGFEPMQETNSSDNEELPFF